MLSLASVSSGLARGGGFAETTGKQFAVVKVSKDVNVCFADIGEGAKLCLKVDCPAVSHKLAKKSSQVMKEQSLQPNRETSHLLHQCWVGTSSPKVYYKFGPSPTKPLKNGISCSKKPDKRHTFLLLTSMSPGCENNIIQNCSRLRQRREVNKAPISRLASKPCHLTAKPLPRPRRSPFKNQTLVLGLDVALHALSEIFVNHVK